MDGILKDTNLENMTMVVIQCSVKQVIELLEDLERSLYHQIILEEVMMNS